MTWTSRFSIGKASSKSSPLPCGTPSTTSTSTTSASSLAAIQCAAVAPTLPAPTMVTFFRIFLLTHVFDHSRGKFTRLCLGSAGHLPLKIVGYILLQNGFFERILDQPRRFFPAQEIKQHHPRKHYRAGIDHVFVRVLGRRAVSGLKYCKAVAHIGPGGNAQPAHLRRASVRNIVAIQIRAGQDAVFLWSNDDLLENGVGDPIIDQYLLLPLPVAVRLTDGIDHALHALVHLSPEIIGSESDPRLDKRGIFFHRQLRV